MQSSVEKVGAIGRKMSVIVPAEQVESAVQKRLKEIAKRAKIQGFRPGKVPIKIVDQHYRGSATSDVLGNIIQTSLQEALSKEEIVPAVQPDILPEQLKKGEDFTYVATFDVYPEIEKLDLAGVKIKKPESEIVDADINRVIENMRKQQLQWEEVTRKAKQEDRVMVDFVGTVDGEEFEGGKAEDYPIVIGESQMLPEFGQGLVGMKAEESKKVEVTFPDDYAEELAGKKAVFSITAKTVSAPKLPEVDAEFIKNFGVESGEQADLRTEVQSNLETNLESQLSTQVRERTFDALLEQNEIEVPLKMVQEEAARMQQEQKNQLIQQGIDPKLLDDLPAPDLETVRPQAEKRVALSLLMMEVIRIEELKPDDERVNARIEKMASSYEDPAEFINYYKTDQQALAQVQSVVLEEQVVDLLLEKADVEVEKIAASELLNMQ